nr:hypothetical protein Iba_chr03bCG7920 [Ipomoea batatas]
MRSLWPSKCSTITAINCKPGNAFTLVLQPLLLFPPPSIWKLLQGLKAEFKHCPSWNRSFDGQGREGL